ncbi:PKD domain-containing protein [Flexibacter flexilis DSM 6793]|uniref:PKD domain-containing protein n=1 Tax=Flexibacter flexilis DSM 6793 TaxID=927664 RepID=A0A1I1G0T3_9BACT|nr:gliding motility-associated C-terminal domain-containing protein [Flexibacter flexilis]SFC05429.1 PKD domain-containing protein [Flexibacter flexilis DSM 6793]
MQKYYYLLSLFLWGMIGAASAQVGYRLEMRPKVSQNADTLFVDVFSLRTTATTFTFGNSNFLININPAQLDTARSVGGMGISVQGRWSNNTAQGGDATQYLPMLLGRSPQANFVNLQIRQRTGTGLSGIEVPTDSALIARIFFKIKDCKATAALQWRVGQQGVGAINNFQNQSIYSGATFINPAPTLLHRAATVPNVTFSVTQSSVAFAWQNQQNILLYQMNVNGGGWQNVTPSALDTAYNVTGLSGGQTITFQARAIVPCDTVTSSLVSATTTAGCTTLPPAPTGINNTVCGSGTVVLTVASAATEYRWYTAGGTLIAGATGATYTTPLLTTTTSYLVSAVVGGCESSDRTMVTAFVSPIPAVPTALTGSTNVCVGSSQTYTVTTPTLGASYEWKVENGTVLSGGINSVDVLWPATVGTGIISVKEISSVGCKSVDSLVTNVTISQGMTLAANIPDSVVVGQTIQLSVTAPDADEYSWYFTDDETRNTGTVITHTFNQEGGFSITLKGKKLGGCEDSLRKNILVKRVQVIYVPNAFSPKANSQENKTLKVYAYGVSNTNFLFEVYNRWGEMVYKTANFDEINQSGWNGGDQELGVYTYILKGLFSNGQVIDQTGTITLIR